LGFYLVQILTGLSGAATLFLVAAGLSIIFGVTRVVNFAHGSFYMLGAYLAVTLTELFGRTTHLGFWGGVLAAALVVGLLGVLVEVLVLRRIYKAPELFQLLATFGVILVIQDLALWTWGAEDLQGPRAPGLRGAVTILGARLPAYDLVLIAASPVVLGGLWLLFKRTRWGVLVRAATADREMVGALGVDQARLFTAVFFLGSFLAGLAGAIQIPKGGANLLMDFGVIAAAFVVVVIGGMGSIGGAFLASLIIGQLQAFGVLFLPQATLVSMFLVWPSCSCSVPGGCWAGRTRRRRAAPRLNSPCGRRPARSEWRSRSCLPPCSCCPPWPATSRWCSRSRFWCWPCSPPACTRSWGRAAWRRSATRPTSAAAPTRRRWPRSGSGSGSRRRCRWPPWVPACSR
jgi:branched-chain amino acid transport system permease protein